MIIRSKVAKENIRLKRNLKGMKKCNKNCTACPYVQEGSAVKKIKQKWNITKNVNCETFNCVYGRSRHDGYLYKKLGIFALLYFHNVNYTTQFFFN